MPDPYVYDLNRGDELIFVRRTAEASVLYERARDGAVLRLGPGGPEVAIVSSVALRPTKRPTTMQVVLRVDNLIAIEADAEDDEAVLWYDDDAPPEAADYRVVTFAPGDHTVAEVEAALETGDLDLMLHAVLGLEVTGQDRKGVRDAIQARLAKLEAAEE